MIDGHDAARGARVAALRKARAMTQDVLAGAAGVSVQTVKRAEAGKPMQAETVQAFCAALGAEPSDILGPATPSPVVPTTPCANADGAVQTPSLGAPPRGVPVACRVFAVLAFALAGGVENGAWGLAGQTVLDFRIAQAVAVGSLAAGILALVLPAMAGRGRPAWAVVACALAVLAAGLEPSAMLARDYRAGRAGVGHVHEVTVAGDAIVGRWSRLDRQGWVDPAGDRSDPERRAAIGSLVLWSMGSATSAMLANEVEPDIVVGSAQVERCRDALHRPGRGTFAACREAYVRLVRHGYAALGEAFLGGPLLDLSGFDDIDRRFEALAPARARLG